MDPTNFWQIFVGRYPARYVTRDNAQRLAASNQRASARTKDVVMGLKKLLIVLCAIFSCPAFAGFQTAGDLYRGLEAFEHHRKNIPWTRQEAADFEFANGYIQSVADVLDQRSFCVIPHTKGGQLMLAVKLYIDRHQALKSIDAHLVIGMALAELYPCKQKV